MAELEIGPQPVGTGGISARIPSSSPVLEQGQASAKEVESKALWLLAGVRRQEQANQNTNALIAFKTKINHIDEQAAGIQDLDKKVAFIHDNYNKALDEVHKQYPKISDNAFKTIQLGASDSLHSVMLKVAATQHAQARRDFAATLSNGAKSAAAAHSQAERQQLEKALFGHIDQSNRNGIISDAEAQKAKIGFGLQVQKAHYDELLATNPIAVLAVPYDKSGLPAKDFLAYQAKANKILTYAEDEPTRQYKTKQEQAMQEATPQNAQELYDKGLITPSYAKFMLGHKPTEGDEELSNHFMGEMLGARSPDEADEIYRQALGAGVSGTGKGMLTNMLQERRSDLKTERGLHTQDLVDDLRSNIEDADPTYYMPSMEGFSGNRKFNAQMIRNATLQFKEAKTYEDMDKIHDKLLQQMKARYNPTPTLTPLSGPGDKKPTEATPAEDER